MLRLRIFYSPEFGNFDSFLRIGAGQECPAQDKAGSNINSFLDQSLVNA